MARTRFLGGLLETKKANPKDAGLRAAGRALSNGSQPLGVAGPWDMDKAVKDGLERTAHVFRCVDAISQTQARIPMELRKIQPGKARNEAPTVDDVDTWKLLNFRANRYESSFQFRYRLSATLLLSRRGAFVEMVKGKNGKVVELHLMSPGMVEPIPDPDKFVKGYQIMRGDYVVDEVEPERVAWIKIKPHPSDPYSQLTPLMAAGLAVETDYLARIFNRNFMANDGRPGMLVAIQGQLGPEDAEEIKARFSGGPARAGQTSVIEADGMSATDLAATPRDIQWGELLSMTKDDILLSFGVPESVMGNASGRTFDNADAERENYYIDTMQPHCDPIAFGLDAITGDINDDLVIAYDYSSVDVLQRLAARKREERRSEWEAGLITVDEYREDAERDVFGVPASRVLYLPNGAAIAKNDEDQTALDDLKAIPVQAGGGGPAPADGSSSEQGALSGVRQGLAEADRQRGNTEAATSVRERALRLVKSSEITETKGAKKPRPSSVSGGALRNQIQHPYMGLRYKMEGVIEGHLTQWDTRQENVITDRLNHINFRKGTRHWTESKDLPKNQKCKYCKEPATKRVIHSEGMAYVATCSEHLGKGKTDAAACVPSGKPDPSNIDAVRDIKSDVIETLTWTPEYTKEIDAKYAVNTDQWVTELLDGMGTFVQKSMKREARKAAKNLKIDGVGQFIEIPGNDELDRVVKAEYKAVEKIIRDAAKNQSDRLQAMVKEMNADGASMKQIETKVRQMIGVRAPWRKQLAANVTTTAIEAARGSVYDRAKNLYVKEWMTENDARVRPTHTRADGQKRVVRNPFTVGGHKMMRPGDPSAPIEEKANCRCWLRYELSDQFFKRQERAER